MGFEKSGCARENVAQQLISARHENVQSHAVRLVIEQGEAFQTHVVVSMLVTPRKLVVLTSTTQCQM